MSQTVEGKAKDGAPVVAAPVPKSVTLASGGITTMHDAQRFLSALVTDIMTEEVSIRKANAACNAMGKLFKGVEMQQKYGPSSEGATAEPLLLVAHGPQLVPAPDKVAAKEERRKLLLAELEALDKAS